MSLIMENNFTTCITTSYYTSSEHSILTTCIISRITIKLINYKKLLMLKCS